MCCSGPKTPEEPIGRNGPVSVVHLAFKQENLSIFQLNLICSTLKVYCLLGQTGLLLWLLAVIIHGFVLNTKLHTQQMVQKLSRCLLYVVFHNYLEFTFLDLLMSLCFSRKDQKIILKVGSCPNDDNFVYFFFCLFLCSSQVTLFSESLPAKKTQNFAEN